MRRDFQQVEAGCVLPHAGICWAKRCSSGSTLPIEEQLEEDSVVHRATRAFCGETE
jgi:hypothetical protein